MSMYQKYRPADFVDVFHQDQAVTYLQNIVNLAKDGKDFPHAYIIFGTFGIGKTTLARIFAKSLGINNEDIIELDAASTSRKIEDMRKMIDSTHNLPIYSKYKAYIIDEAHALTSHSATAFLKTLEEPINHNIFILCTTNKNNISPTIKSRCVNIELKSPSQRDIQEYLNTIAIKENTEISEDDIQIITKHSNNSYRDAIVNLEKYLHNDKSISIFGNTDGGIYLNIIKYLINKDMKSLLSLINSENDFDYDYFLEILRQGMLYRNGVKDILIIDSNSREELETILKEKDNQIFFNSKTLLYFLDKLMLFKNTHNKKTALIAIFGAFLE